MNIAIRRDRDSFAALYDRYMSAAYNLALHLTSNTSLADEAVQEAMRRLSTVSDRMAKESSTFLKGDPACRSHRLLLA